ncbi:hypothetical protein [Ectopseudomonas guguanensis]|uniref:hypothetical protein n=1 Tax=Ectopseudomonas guguanensis TaxID=1198456 RepID=UPI001428A960
MTRLETGRELLVVEGKNMTAGMALKVIEYAGIDFFTHARASQAANGTTRQAAEDGACQATQGSTDRACDRTKGRAALCAGQSARRSGCSATDSASSTADLASMVTCSDAFRITERAVDRHRSGS